jgi:hypothetical protein
MKRSLLITLFVLLLSPAASAQEGVTRTALTGVVYDTNGAVIMNVRVFAHGPDGKRYEARTNHEGTYDLLLPLGVYSVEGGGEGFCPTQVEGFRVVNSTFRKMALDFVLEVAPTHTSCKHKMRVDSGYDDGERPNIIID